MNTIIDLRSYVDPSIIPILVLVDLQQEYLASPRALAIPETSEAIENCRLALGHARRLGFPVAFVRWVGRTPFFNPHTPFSRWIAGFEPTGVDMIFERDRPSCYASARFDDVVAQGGGNFVVAGLAGEAACLSTVIDAFHRRHNVTFLSDASASHGLEEIGSRDVHRVVTKIIDLYGDAVSTKTWIAATSRRGSLRGEKLWTKT